CNHGYSALAHPAHDFVASIGGHDLTLDYSAGRVRRRIVQRISWRRRGLHPHAVDGLRARNSNPSRRRHRSFRSHHLGQLRHFFPRHQRQCRYFDRARHAHRRCHRRTARRDLDPIFRRPEDSSRFRSASAHRRGHCHLHDVFRSQTMNILICSDGTPASDNAARLGGIVASATQAQVMLLGIAENPSDEQPLRQALDQEAHILRRANAKPRVVLQSGEPIAQILSETSSSKYDIIVIGSRRRNAPGRTYEIIKAVEPSVLVAIGTQERQSRILLCSGGNRFIDDAVRLTGTLAAALHAQVTLFHVMAEPPAIYAHLRQLEEDVTALLASGSELGRNLVAEKKALEKLGVVVNVRVRHGFIIDQLLDEMREGNYDLIVTGSSRTRGPLHHYIMG